MRAEFGLAACLLILAHTGAPGVAAQESAAPEPTLQQRLERIEAALANQGLLQMLQQLETLELEINRLRGEVEVQNHTLEQLKKRQRDMYADMDRRLQRFENPAALDTLPGAGAPPLQTLAPLGSTDVAGGAAGAGTSLTLELVNQDAAPDAGGPGAAAPEAGVPAPTVPGAEQDLPLAAVTAEAPASAAAAGAASATETPETDNAQTEMAGMEATALATPGPALPDAAQPQTGPESSAPPELPDTSVATDAPPLQQDPQLIQAEYRQAFNLLKEARYEQAVLALRGFLTRYPDSEFAANAQFWLAEAYYVNSLFGQALAEYGVLTQRYPDSPKLAQAKLKAAFCRHELGQVEPAIQQLEEIILQHPGTTAASLARDRLAAIAAETAPADIAPAN